MPTPLQGYIGQLQGSGASLQGSSPFNLQGSSPAIQGPAQPAPKKITYGNTAATSPAKQQFMDSLKAYKYQDDPTVYGNYNGASDYAFHSEQEFKNAGGNFSNVETRQRPQVVGNPSTVATKTPPPTTESPKASPLETARTAYLESLNPSTALSDAKRKYLDFVTNEKLGENALEGQGRGIPLSIVQGQQGKLRQQSLLEAQRLQGDIDIAQGESTANQSKAKTAVDFATADVTNNKPLELASGSSLVKLNPTTGKYETIANGSPKPETLPASAQEYEYAKKNGYTGTYEQYQTEDANRKRSVTNIIGSSGLNSQQAGLFNQIVTQYNKSPLVAASDRTPVLQATIDKIKQDPSNATQQLNLGYAYIQALDTYQSSVREGELNNLNTIDSKIGSLQNYATQMTSGQLVRPEVALEIAKAAQDIVTAIKSAAAQKAKSYQSQAQTLGLGDAWNSYTSGFTPTYNSGGQNNASGSENDPLGLGL